MSLGSVIGGLQIAIAAMITGLFMHWYQEASKYFVFPLTKLFMNGVFWLIPICGLGVGAFSFVAYPGPPSRKRGAKLLAWQIGLLVMSVVYLVHGFEFNRDLHLFTLEDLFKNIKESKPNSTTRQVAVGVAKFIRQAAFETVAQVAPYPWNAWFWLFNRPFLCVVCFGLMPLIISIVSFLMVNAERLDNYRETLNEEENDSQSRHTLI
jgi:hypothetical protein